MYSRFGVLNRLRFRQTSQDPNSPVGAEAASSAVAAALTPGVGGGFAESRDGWDNEEWGSLEEEPVSSLNLLCFGIMYS